MSSYCPPYKYIFHGIRLNYADDFKSKLSPLGLETLESWSHFQEGEIISSGTTTCIKVKTPNLQKVIYFKRYAYTKNKWEFFLRRSKAANEFLNYQTLKKLNIPTLDVLALYEQRQFGRLSIACIVTNELPNTLQLDDFYTKVLLKMPKKKREDVFNSIKKQLFEQLNKAHDAGFFHLDLKWRNILIQQEGDSYLPIWIDCPRGLQRHFLNYHLKVADLSGLSRKALSFFSTSQLYRMLYMYLGKSANKDSARKLFTDVQKHLEKRPPKGWKTNP